MTSSVLGTLAGGSAANTQYQVALDPAVVAGRLGGAGTMALSSTSTDTLWLWAKEFTAATYRPQLTLVFEPTP